MAMQASMHRTWRNRGGGHRPSMLPQGIVAYAWAVLLSTLAVTITERLQPWVGESIFPLLLGAVFLSTRLGGVGPGMLSIALTELGAATILLDRSEGALSLAVRLGIFALSAVGIAALTARLGRSVEATQKGEDVIRQRDQALRLFIEHTPAPVAILDREMRYIATSRRWREDFQLGERDLVGRSHYEVFPELPERWKEIHRRCLAGAVESAAEDRFVRADGRVDWIRWEVHPWPETDGSVGGIIIFSEMITERKEAERVLRESARELEQRVRERTLDLEETNRDLDAFASLVAHDLRVPLRAVQIFPGMLRDTAKDRLTPEERDELDRIQAAAKRMDMLVQDLLAYSRLRRRGFPRERLDLGEALREVRSDLAAWLSERRVRVEVEEPLPSVMGDRTALTRALANLVVNAATYVAKGVEPRIRIRTERREDRVRVWVEDNGIGIAAEDRERIFEPLVRLHREEDIPGTGLGLAIVRRAAERMGGAAGVESEPGKGSRFWIEVPGA